MAIDLSAGAKAHARAALAGIAGLTVYGRKAQRQLQIPCVTIRVIAEETLEYVSQRGERTASVLRVELRANSEAECERLDEEIREAIAAGGRMLDRSLYYEGVETDSGSEASGSALYRSTSHYRISEI